MKLIVIPCSPGHVHIADLIRRSDIHLDYLDHAFIGGEICRAMLAALERGIPADRVYVKVRFDPTE